MKDVIKTLDQMHGGKPMPAQDGYTWVLERCGSSKPKEPTRLEWLHHKYRNYNLGREYSRIKAKQSNLPSAQRREIRELMEINHAHSNDQRK
jgi:hypothetical protein